MGKVGQKKRMGYKEIYNSSFFCHVTRIVQAFATLFSVKYVYLPDGISGEILHLDLQMALL